MTDLCVQKFYDKPLLSTYPYSEEIFALLGVKKEDEKHLRVFDEDDDFILVHYLRPLPRLAHIRGIILTRDAPIRIVGMSHPFTEELLPQKAQNDPRLKDLEKFEAVQAIEGTILRVYGTGEGRFNISTHKKLNSTKSRWSSGVSFGNQFMDIWGDTTFESILYRNRCYVFILSHPDNRLVCNVSTPKLTLGAVYFPLGNSMMREETSKLRHHIKPRKLPFEIQELLPLYTMEDVISASKKLSYEESPGIMISLPGVFGKEQTWKIVPESYANMRDVRGSEPDLFLRYLDCKFMDQYHEDALRKLYPEYKSDFDDLDVNLERLTPYLVDLYEHDQGDYRNRPFPPEEYHIIKATRKNYNTSISLKDNIENQLCECTAYQIYTMIQHIPKPKVQ
jgi:hypothetical protein